MLPSELTGFWPDLPHRRFRELHFSSGLFAVALTMLSPPNMRKHMGNRVRTDDLNNQIPCLRSAGLTASVEEGDAACDTIDHAMSRRRGGAVVSLAPSG